MRKCLPAANSWSQCQSWIPFSSPSTLGWVAPMKDTHRGYQQFGPRIPPSLLWRWTWNFNFSFAVQWWQDRAISHIHKSLKNQPVSEANNTNCQNNPTSMYYYCQQGPTNVRISAFRWCPHLGDILYWESYQVPVAWCILFLSSSTRASAESSLAAQIHGT